MAIVASTTSTPYYLVNRSIPNIHGIPDYDMDIRDTSPNEVKAHVQNVPSNFL